MCYLLLKTLGLRKRQFITTLMKHFIFVWHCAIAIMCELLLLRTVHGLQELVS